VTTVDDALAATRHLVDRAQDANSVVLASAAVATALEAVTLAVQGLQPQRLAIGADEREKLAALLSQSFADYPAGHFEGRWDYVASRAAEFFADRT
jgi:hypothetical protein